MRRVPCLLAALLLATCAGAEEGPCAGIPPVALPEGPVPTVAQQAGLISCDSEALLHGIGMEQDLVAARLCATFEFQSRADELYRGAGILLVIHANGLGVPRNLGLARQLSCHLGGSKLDLRERARLLGTMESDPALRYDPEMVAMSTRAIGQVVAHRARFRAVERDRERLAALALLPTAALAEWPHAESAAHSFIETRSREEIDLSGTLRGVFTLEERLRLEDRLVEDLQQVASRQAPLVADAPLGLGASDSAQALLDLDGALQRALATSHSNPGTVDRAAIQRTQAAWERYEREWLRLVWAVEPLRATSWQVALRQARTRQLLALAGEPETVLDGAAEEDLP